MPSADGRGRTIFEILTGRNKRDMTPLEFQHYNPLEAKIGCTVFFEHNEELSNINFFITAIRVYETLINGKKFYHTDYYLKGNSLDLPQPLRFSLRLIPDPDSNNELGHKMYLLKLVDEVEFDEGLQEALNDPTGIFQVQYDDEGNELADDEIWNFHRVDGVSTPYMAKTTTLKDDNKDGTINPDELERHEITYWDYFRTDVVDPSTEQKYTQYLTVERDDEAGIFTFLRGKEVAPFTVSVI